MSARENDIQFSASMGNSRSAKAPPVLLQCGECTYEVSGLSFIVSPVAKLLAACRVLGDKFIYSVHFLPLETS